MAFGPDVAVLPLDALVRALALERGVLGRGAFGRHGEVGLRAVLTSVSCIARTSFWTPGTCDNAVALDERGKRVTRGLALAAAAVDPGLSEDTDRPIVDGYLARSARVVLGIGVEALAPATRTRGSGSSRARKPGPRASCRPSAASSREWVSTSTPSATCGRPAARSKFPSELYLQHSYREPNQKSSTPAHVSPGTGSPSDAAAAVAFKRSSSRAAAHA